MRSGWVLFIGLWGVFASAATAQDVEPSVTYRTVAVPASKAMLDLGRLAKKTIRIEPPLDSQVLVLNLNHVPLNEALDKICVVLHGEWSEEKNVVTISRPPSLVQQLRESEAAQDRELIAKGLNGIVSGVLAHPLTRESFDRMLNQAAKVDLKAEDSDQQLGKIDGDQDGLDEGAYLVARVIPYLDKDAFLESQTSGRLVFSTDPKPLQRRLDIPPDTLQQIADEQNLWTDYYDRLGKLSPKLKEDIVPNRKHIDSRGLRVIAIVDSDLSVYIVDSTGAVCAEGELHDVGVQDKEDETPLDVELAKRKFLPVSLSPLASEMLSLRRAEPGSSGPSAALKTFILHPEQRDPLSLAPSEILLASADQEGLNVVASPTDSLAFARFTSGPLKVGLDQILALAEEEQVCKFDGGSLLVYTDDPYDPYTTRANRSSLGEFLRKVDGRPFPTIDDMADYVLVNPSIGALDLAATAGELLHPAMGQTWELSYSALKIWGLLSGSERTRLLSGETVPLHDLSPDVGLALNPIVRNSGNQGLDADEDGLVRSRKPLGSGGQRFGDVTEEIDAIGGSIRVKTRPGWLIKGVQASRGTPSGLASVLDLARHVFSDGSAGLDIAYAPTTAYDFYIDLKPGLSLHLCAVQCEGDMSASMPYSRLPASLRAAVDEDVRRLGVAHAVIGDQPSEEGLNSGPPFAFHTAVARRADRGYADR